MIITRTPYRISFFGGGSDYPEYFTKHGGAVLGATIDKYCWITVRPRSPFGPRYKVIYSQVEECDRLDDIKHPAVRECLRYFNVDGCEIYHTSDLPARSGIGSSSAFVVGLLNALCRMPGGPVFCDTPNWFAYTATKIEREILKETVGYQDQILCSYGGFSKIFFPKNADFRILRYYSLVPQRGGETWPCFKRFNAVFCLHKNLMLFYTGIQRTSSDITSTYVNNLLNHDGYMRRIQDMPSIAIEMLDKWDDQQSWNFGTMLGEAWSLKKGLGESISTPELDKIYDKAIEAGALGGKLLGGGGGGFFLFYVPPERQKFVRFALEELTEVPFEFEREGSKVVYQG